jgi:hypothetical protein
VFAFGLGPVGGWGREVIMHEAPLGSQPQPCDHAGGAAAKNARHATASSDHSMPLAAAAAGRHHGVCTIEYRHPPGAGAGASCEAPADFRGNGELLDGGESG